MADPTPQQAQQIQTIAAQVEAAYQNMVRSRTALSYLTNAGKATCEDVKTYNLLAMSTFYYQKSMSDTIRGMGGQAPEVHPPLYVAYKGVPGDQAVDIDCSKAQMQGWTPTGLGDFYVNPQHVEWRTGPRVADLESVKQTLARVKFDNGQAQLGYVGLIITLIVAGVVLAVVGYIVLKIVEVLGDLPQKVEYTKQMTITAERHRATLEARAKCLADCQAQGKDPIACAKSCAKLLPDFNPPPDTGGFGILGWVLGIAIVGGLGYLAWRWWSGGHLLGVGSGDSDSDDGSGDDPDRDALDVDFIERVA